MNSDFHEFWDKLQQVLQVLLVNIVMWFFVKNKLAKKIVKIQDSYFWNWL